MQGVCLSGSECDSRGGFILGTCAAGFGSCCAIYVSDCSSDNFQFNLTYIVNPGTEISRGIQIGRLCQDFANYELDLILD